VWYGAIDVHMQGMSMVTSDCS